MLWILYTDGLISDFMHYLGFIIVNAVVKNVFLINFRVVPLIFEVIEG